MMDVLSKSLKNFYDQPASQLPARWASPYECTKATITGPDLALRNFEKLPQYSRMLRLEAGTHVKDLILCEESWLDIRPVRNSKEATCERSHSSDMLEAAKELTRAQSGYLSIPPQEKRQKTMELPTVTVSHHGSGVSLSALPSEGPKPFKVYAGVNMSEQANLWTSETISGVINMARSRPVELPGMKSATFGDIFDMITSRGFLVYVYGGVLRDVIMKVNPAATTIATTTSAATATTSSTAITNS